MRSRGQRKWVRARAGNPDSVADRPGSHYTRNVFLTVGVNDVVGSRGTDLSSGRMIMKLLPFRTLVQNGTGSFGSGGCGGDRSGLVGDTASSRQMGFSS